MEVVRISSKGQLTIPRSMRESFGIQQGDEFLVNAREGVLVLEPLKYKSLDQLFSAVHNKDYISDEDIQTIVRKQVTSQHQ